MLTSGFWNIVKMLVFNVWVISLSRGVIIKFKIISNYKFLIIWSAE